jgi:hypothetical protein
LRAHLAVVPEDPLFVRLDLRQVVLLHRDPSPVQLVHRHLDVVHREVEDGVLGGGVAIRRIDQHRRAAGDVELEALLGLDHVDAERLAVELLRGPDVGDGEAAEGLRVLEHVSPLAVFGSHR